MEQRRPIQFKIVSITHNLLHKSQPSYLSKLIYIKPTGKTRSSDHLCLSLTPLTSKLKFSDQSLRNASPRLWTLFPPSSGLSLNKFLHHPLQHPFHSTHYLFHAVSSSPASKHTYSLFHTPLNSPPSSPIYGFQPVSSAKVVTRMSTREYTNTIGFTGLYKALIYLLTYLRNYLRPCKSFKANHWFKLIYLAFFFN